MSKTNEETSTSDEYTPIVEGDCFKIYKTAANDIIEYDGRKIKIEAPKYSIFLSDSIESGSEYIGLIHWLQNTNKSDYVDFYLANFGGLCSGLIALFNGIRAAKAYIKMHVISPSYSAGATLALLGDALELHPHSFLMFHNFSGGFFGKGNETLDNFVNESKWIHDYMKDLHCPFLTLTEHNKLIKDQDVYIHWDDPSLPKRLERHFK